MHSYFISYNGLKTTEDQIHNGATLHVAYPILSIPCLLMPWRLKSPGYQQARYWPQNWNISLPVSDELAIRRHWFRWCWAPNHRQAIISTNNGLFYWWYMPRWIKSFRHADELVNSRAFKISTLNKDVFQLMGKIFWVKLESAIRNSTHKYMAHTWKAVYFLQVKRFSI